MAGTKVKPKYTDYNPVVQAQQQMSPVMKLILDRILMPWLFKVLTKYTYEEFHFMMSGYHHDELGRTYAGRDFVADLKQNHTTKWNWFIGQARAHRDKLEFDVNHHHNTLVSALEQKGWPLTYHEKKGLYQTLMRIWHLIFD